MPENQLLSCPYDSSHRIWEYRMSKHLIKCKLNNPNIKLLTCPYNTIHRIKPLEYEKHLLECKDKRTDEMYEFKKDSSKATNVIPIKNINELEIPSSSENWDEDPGTSQSYLQNLEEKTEEFPLAAPGKLKKKELQLQEQEYYNNNVASTSSFKPQTSESANNPGALQLYLQNLEEKTEKFLLVDPGKLKLKELKLQEKEYYDDNVATTSPFRLQTSESTNKTGRSLQLLKIESSDTECSKKIWRELLQREDDKTTPTKDTTIVKPSKLKDVPIDKLSISSDTKIKNNETIKTPKETTPECTLGRLKIHTNLNIGRGMFRTYEIQKKLEMSEKNFESKFMNSPSDVKSLEDKYAETNYNKGIFVGYSEEDFHLDLDDIDDW